MFYRGLPCLALWRNVFLQARRLLASFQNNLEEITIIATPDDDVADGPPSRAVQLHSFVDPCKGAAN